MRIDTAGVLDFVQSTFALQPKQDTEEGK